MEVRKVLRVDIEQNVDQWQSNTDSSGEEQVPSQVVVLILVEVREHHDEEGDSTQTVAEAEVEPPELAHLVACERVVDRGRSTA